MWNRRRPSQPNDPWAEPDPALALALQQVHWYARHRDRTRRIYWAIESLTLLTTAATTVVAALKVSAWITAVLAASALVLTGLRKILDLHDSWIAFGVAWADLQIAVNEYRLLSNEQRDDEARSRLVRKVNEVIEADTGGWASRRRSRGEAGGLQPSNP